MLQSGDPYGAIVMDTCFFSPFKVIIGAVFQPLPGVFLVVETDSPEGPCRIALITGFCARGRFTQQAASRLFVEEKIGVFHGHELFIVTVQI